VLSATYRQSSRLTPELAESRSKQPTAGSDAAAAGRGGDDSRSDTRGERAAQPERWAARSVFPPIPDGALAVSFRSRSVWETSRGEDRYRRGLYTFWKRSVPYPSMSVFDAPNADVSCTRRARSNSPLQALTTLNDAAFMEAAQALALRIWREGGTDDADRVSAMGSGSAPDEGRTSSSWRRLQALLEKQRGRFAGETAAAVYVAAPDLSQSARLGSTCTSLPRGRSSPGRCSTLTRRLPDSEVI
jgi:hypothetical protein